jgi:hypothetical protein
MTMTETSADRYCLTIWLPSHARVDSVHATEADVRQHLASEASRLGLADALAALLPDEVTVRDFTLGGHPAHPRDDPAPIRWQIFRGRSAIDRIPGDEHINDAVLQHRGVRLGDPGAVTVTAAEAAAALGPHWRTIRGMARRAAVATPAEAARLRTAWDSALDDGGALAAAADAVHDAHRESRRATIGVGAWTALRLADAASRGVPPERVGTATILAAACAARATMVEDLVGQHGLTREHVEMVRQPWVAAFGAVD